MLPPDARAAIRGWTLSPPLTNEPGSSGGDDGVLIEPGALRAHLRLLREFLREHLTEGRQLRAFEVWERGQWSEAAPAPDV
jgi:DNA repair protein RecO (recombination protein O)